MFYLGRPSAGFCADLIDELRVLLKVVKFVKTKFFIASLCRGNSVGVLKIVKAKPPDGERIRADPGDLFIDINIKTLEDRQNHHEGRHADDHSQQGEKRPQLVRPDGVECEFESFGKRHSLTAYRA